MDALKSGAIFRLKNLSSIRSPQSRTLTSPEKERINNKRGFSDSKIQNHVSILKETFDDIYRATPIPVLFQKNKSLTSVNFTDSKEEKFKDLSSLNNLTSHENSKDNYLANSVDVLHHQDAPPKDNEIENSSTTNSQIDTKSSQIENKEHIIRRKQKVRNIGSDSLLNIVLSKNSNNDKNNKSCLVEEVPYSKIAETLTSHDIEPSKIRPNLDADPSNLKKTGGNNNSNSIGKNNSLVKTRKSKSSKKLRIPAMEKNTKKTLTNQKPVKQPIRRGRGKGKTFEALEQSNTPSKLWTLPQQKALFQICKKMTLDSSMDYWEEVSSLLNRKNISKTPLECQEKWFEKLETESKKKEVLQKSKQIKKKETNLNKVQEKMDNYFEDKEMSKVLKSRSYLDKGQIDVQEPNQITELDSQKRKKQKLGKRDLKILANDALKSDKKDDIFQSNVLKSKSGHSKSKLNDYVHNEEKDERGEESQRSEISSSDSDDLFELTLETPSKYANENLEVTSQNFDSSPLFSTKHVQSLRSSRSISTSNSRRMDLKSETRTKALMNRKFKNKAQFDGIDGIINPVTGKVIYKNNRDSSDEMSSSEHSEYSDYSR